MKIKEKIINEIEKALKTLEIQEGNIVLEHPADFKMGDYSTNIAMTLAPTLKTNPARNATHNVAGGPKELAEKIVTTMSRSDLDMIQDIQAVNGFINFHLAPEFFAEAVAEAGEEKDFGKNKIFKGQKFFIEHTQPNPFKDFHIGHLMNNAIGESIARIVKANGGEVKTATYHGDVGMHVAKAVWGYLREKNWTSAYAYGAKTFEEDEKVRQEVAEINKKIYEESDPDINKIYKAGCGNSFKYFEDIYIRLNSHFDYHFLESEAGKIGRKIVLQNTGTIFERGDGGSTVFRGEKFGLHTRVFLNQEGLPTYEAKELGLAKIKKEKYEYDKSITITGNEQDAYFKVVEVAIGEVFPELKGKLKHFSHGMLRLPTGKMSSRTGDVIKAVDLIEEVKRKLAPASPGGVPDERVAIAAIKYMILRSSIGGDIIFDIEKSVSTEGDSGVYLQYAHARASAILEKAKAEKVKAKAKLPQGPTAWQTNEVEKLLYRFPEVVERAGDEFAPHYIVNYLTEFARAYNSFYGAEQIVKKDDPASAYKVALSAAFARVLQNGLSILGIAAPERM